jgi:16S rRNA (guanine527-N7)-methyltransferase
VKHIPGFERRPLPDPAASAEELAPKLAIFAELLTRWNAHINLVASGDVASLHERHILDSLQLLPLLPPSGLPIADLGTGGGFPGLVLAIATGREFHLVEADRRKAAFLNEVTARLGLSRTVVHAGRAEAVKLPPMGAVTARALAPLAVLLPSAHRLLAAGGIAIFPKGRTANSELSEVAPLWSFNVVRYASRTDADSTVLRISEIERATQEF